MSKKATKGTKKTTALAKVGQSTLLASVIASIQKKHGSESITTLGSSAGMFKLPDQISSGSLTLDMCLGPFHQKEDGTWQHGFARGRTVEIFGPESGGKTTLCLHIIAASQRRGGVCAFIDAEHALDPNWARRLGVKLDDLLISQPKNGEEALQITEDLLRSNSIDVLVVDSVAALIPKKMLEGEIGDATMGLQAKLMSEALSKFTSISNKTLLIFTNQLREKLGQMFGNPETTPGGRALRFYASYRLDVRRIGGEAGTIKGKDPTTGTEMQIGHRTRVKVIKNKLAPPYQVAEYDFLYDLRPDLPAGVDKVAELVDIAVTLNIIELNGAFHYFGGVCIGQGRRATIDHTRLNKDLMWKIFNQVMVMKLAQRGYNPDLTPIDGMPSLPVVMDNFEPPTAEDLANSDGQDIVDGEIAKAA